MSDILGTTEYPLPSRGLLYEGAIPGGIVQLRPFKTREQALLTSQGGGPLGKAEAVLQSCCKLPSPTFKHLDLLSTDRLAILVALRTKTFGPEYTFKWKCTNCRRTNNAMVDIVQDLRERPGIEGKLVEPVLVELPIRKTTVSVRFSRGTDEILVMKYAKQMESRSAELGDPAYSYKLALQLQDEDDKPIGDVLARQRFVDDLHARDLLVIERAMSDAETGIDTRLTLTCVHCDSTSEASMPFTPEFFRPGSPGD